MCSAKLWTKLSLHCLPSDPNIRKSELTLFLMQIWNASVKTRSFVYTSVSNRFYYVITIALADKQIVWYEYLWVFNLNPNSVYLWRM